MSDKLKPQWDWLADLKPGTRVVAKDKSTWIRLAWGDTNLFANINTGEVVHFSSLASETHPPRIECYPSPFSS